MAKIGDTFRTGEVNPVSGDFEFVRHIKRFPWWMPTPEENQIPLSKGERFPPHKSCAKGVIWKLIKIR